MQVAHENPRSGRGTLVRVVSKALLALVGVLGLIYLGTMLIEAVLPQLPNQARAAAGAPADAGSNAAPTRTAPAKPASVEHFHSAFRLAPGADAPAHADTF